MGTITSIVGRLRPPEPRACVHLYVWVTINWKQTRGQSYPPTGQKVHLNSIPDFLNSVLRTNEVRPGFPGAGTGAKTLRLVTQPEFERRPEIALITAAPLVHRETSAGTVIEPDLRYEEVLWEPDQDAAESDAV